MDITNRPGCPHCGSENVSYIMYGLPAYSEELQRQLEEKEVILGGCMITPLSEQWYCQDCEERFGKVPLSDYIPGYKDEDYGEVEA